MFINSAHAQETTSTIQMSPPADMPAPVMDTQSAVISNIAFVVMIVVIFYFLLIRPQQKRFKDHAAMLDQLKKGDKIITAGGLIGKIEKLTDDEVTIDLGKDMKVTALRSTIQRKKEPVKK